MPVVRVRSRTYERLVTIRKLLSLRYGREVSIPEVIDHLVSLFHIPSTDKVKPLKHLIIDYAIVTNRSLKEVEEELKKACGSLENQEYVRKHVESKLRLLLS